MGRCGCRDTGCACVVDGDTITGAGTEDDPFVATGGGGGGGGTPKYALFGLSNHEPTVIGDGVLVPYTSLGGNDDTGDPDVANLNNAWVAGFSNQIAVPAPAGAAKKYAILTRIDVDRITLADGVTLDHSFDGQIAAVQIRAMNYGRPIFYAPVVDATISLWFDFTEVVPPTYAYPSDGDVAFDSARYTLSFVGAFYAAMAASTSKLSYGAQVWITELA